MATFGLPRHFRNVIQFIFQNYAIDDHDGMLRSPPRIKLFLYNIFEFVNEKQNVLHDAISFSNCLMSVIEACWLPSTGEL
jgi:hypothetical protein